MTREDVYNDLVEKGPLMLDDLIAYLDAEYGQEGWESFKSYEVDSGKT